MAQKTGITSHPLAQGRVRLAQCQNLKMRLKAASYQ